MRILLLNGSHPAGGSSMSTLAFGRALLASGHDVVSVVRSFEHPHRDLLHEQLVDASVRVPGMLGKAIESADSILGRPARIVPGHGHPVWSSPHPEHVLPRLLRLFEPAVVVGNSIDRVSWRRCAGMARRAGSRTALHLREANAIGHLTISQEVPDILLANAESLVALAADAGYKAFLVPSVVELDRCAVESTRRVALLVHPVPEFGLDLVLRLAAARPDVPFVLQESRPLGEDLPALEDRVAGMPNVEVRRRRPAAEVFVDTRVLLVPHQTDGWSNRPRVVLEAQHNGLPVVASDLGGLREAVGEGGLLVPVDAPLERWLADFDQAWSDPGGILQARARAHAARPEVRPVAVVAVFEAVMATIGLGHIRRDHASAGTEPGLSVVIPAYNAEETLGAQLDALLAQEAPRGFEVIVADNLSTDGTAKLVRSRMEGDGRLRLVEASEGMGAGFARNAGAAAARNESIAFCDADDLVGDGWVKAMAEALEHHALVAGTVDVLALNPPELAGSRGLAIGDGPGMLGFLPFAHGCNIGVRSASLEDVGGWDGSIRTGEDIELCMRLWSSGVDLHYEPAAEIHYRLPSTEATSWRRATLYGAAHVDLMRRLEARQLPRPRRLHGLRNLAWLARHCSDLRDEARRPHWLWTAGLSAGRIEGSVRWRTLYL